MSYSADGSKALAEVDPITQTSPESPQLSSIAASELDDNYDIYKQHADEELDPEEAKRVLRKIDLRIVPVLFTIYLLQYLDKNGINYASVYGLQKGTGLVGQDYSWLSSIFYFGCKYSKPPRLQLGPPSDHSRRSDFAVSVRVSSSKTPNRQSPRMRHHHLGRHCHHNSGLP